VMIEPMPMAWTMEYALLMVTMWAVMMAAMMLPGASPAILLILALSRHQEARGVAPMRAGSFAAGYLAVWILFSTAATALQWKLDQMALMTPAMATASVAMAGALLMAAGAYQWTPLKRSCLSHCRSPLDVVTRYWRPGTFGAVTGGVRHGLYCLGCCAFLMALLFVGGIMNLAWVAAITVLILIEKTAPRGDTIARVVGAVLMIWGGLTVFRSLGA
jgi:predicted metal-binding membrane protein